MILDTTFLIDLQREIVRRKPAGAHEFLRRQSHTNWRLAFVSEGEFGCGIADERRDDMRSFLKPFRIIPWSADIAWTYGRVHRQLRQCGQLIGTNDLWIAATALTHRLPVVTRNLEEFRRVDGLDVFGY